MIKLKQPNFVLNAHDIGIPNYKMWISIEAAKGTNTNDLLNHIVRANRLALENQQTQLQNIVLNCHGYGGKVWLGGIYNGALDTSSVGILSPLKGKNLGTIWLTGCRAAQESEGKLFCQMLATVTGSQVVASDSDQIVGGWDGYRIVVGAPGLIDEFEGPVFGFTPNGGISRINPHKDIYTILE